MEIIIPKYLTDYFTSLEKEHGISLTLPQKRWYTMKYKELGEEIRQEYPSTAEESFMGSSDGFWYLRELNMSREQGRITTVPFQPQCVVQTAWDLGYRDKTAIWFFQHLPSGAIHVIDYYENSGEGLAFYYSYLRTLPYYKSITVHHMPHDAAAHEKGSGLSLEQQAKELGLDVNILRRYNNANSTLIMEIQRCREVIARCFFDEEKCAVGIKCLENYRKKWNESMACYTDSPVHDWASHGSDSFRYMCQAIETMARTPDKKALEEERKKIRNARRQMI